MGHRFDERVELLWRKDAHGRYGLRISTRPPSATLGGQCVEHRDDRGRPDPCTQEHTGSSPVERVKLPRGALTSSTSPIFTFLVDVGRRHPSGSRLTLRRDSDEHWVRPTTNSCACRGVSARESEAQHDELAGDEPRSRECRPWARAQRGHVGALAILARHPHRTESRPCRRSGHRSQSGFSVVRASLFLREQRLKGVAPAWAECRYA